MATELDVTPTSVRRHMGTSRREAENVGGYGSGRPEPGAFPQVDRSSIFHVARYELLPSNAWTERGPGIYRARTGERREPRITVWLAAAGGAIVLSPAAPAGPAPGAHPAPAPAGAAAPPRGAPPEVRPPDPRAPGQ